MKTHFLKHVLIGVVIAAGFSAVVMLLWNALIPSIFGLTIINFWQAMGLLALTRILFGGFFGHARRHFHRGNPIHEKWMKMTPEERKEFLNKRRAHMGGRRCGHGHFFDEQYFESNDSDKKE